MRTTSWVCAASAAIPLSATVAAVPSLFTPRPCAPPPDWLPKQQGIGSQSMAALADPDRRDQTRAAR